MKIRQLQYFIRVVEMQNITRAAESLHIAQPALSQQMSLLEEELGVKLLMRRAKGVTATTEGTLLYRHAQTILRQVENTRSLLNKSNNQISGKVSIGLASSTARLISLPLLAAAKNSYPSVVLEVVDIPSVDLKKLVMQGRVDFAISPDHQPIKGLSLTPLFEEELYLLAHPDVQFKNEEVSIAEMSKLSLALPSPPNQLRAIVDRAFLTQRLTYNLFAEASTSAILVPLVAAGLAATVLPYSAVRPEITSRYIKHYRVSAPLKREMMLCFSETAETGVAVEEIIALTQQVIKDLLQRGLWLGCRLLN